MCADAPGQAGPAEPSQDATVIVRVRVVCDRPDLASWLADSLTAGDITTERADLDNLLSQPGGTGEVVVLHLGVSPEELADVTAQARTHVDGPVVVVVEDIREAPLLAALAAGAGGVVLRASGADVIADGVRAAEDGGVFIDPALGHMVAEVVSVMVRAERNSLLTPTELRVIQRFPRGLSNAEIADEFGVSVNTVKTHVRHILAKLECSDRVQAVHVAEEHGLLS